MTEFNELYDKERMHLPWKLYLLGAIASLQKRRVSQSELRSKLDHDPSSLSRILSEMEGVGWIRRTGQSGKKKYIRLTEKGKEMLTKLNTFFLRPD